MNVKKRRFYIDILILMEQLYLFDKTRCNIEELLDSFKYRKVAIYGMGEAGYILFNMLRETKIKVPYVIDNNIDVELNSVIQIKEEELKCACDIDAVIITPLVDYSILEKQVCENCDIPVIGIVEIIEALLEKNRTKG